MATAGSAGSVSLEAALRTCKVDTGWANRIQTDRFLIPIIWYVQYGMGWTLLVVGYVLILSILNARDVTVPKIV